MSLSPTHFLDNFDLGTGSVFLFRLRLKQQILLIHFLQNSFNVLTHTPWQNIYTPFFIRSSKKEDVLIPVFSNPILHTANIKMRKKAKMLDLVFAQSS